jgi:glycerophosphoryl diester phosphodiesterase
VTGKKLIIAHRGAPKLARENTLMAFQKAIDLGADIIELDVRQTKDGELAVFHDQDIGGKKISGLTFAEVNRVAEVQNYQVPTLGQALNLIADKIGLQIEIKEPGYEFKTAEIALEYLKPKNFSIISFDFGILKKIKTQYPQINVGLILGTRYSTLWQMLHFSIKKNKILPVVGLLSVSWKLWQSGFKKLVPDKLPITVWTADEPELITHLLKDKKITAIASNVPDVALKLRKKIYEP